MANGMADAEFLAAFEDATLPEACFHHRDHVRLVWLYLQRYPAVDVLVRFSAGLHRLARAFGKAGLYHETITWAYVLLIHERMARAPGDGTWEGFAAANPDLLAWQPSVLAAYYRKETLGSDLARRVFVLPDRGAETGKTATLRDLREGRTVPHGEVKSRLVSE
jgi:hypothetical protein